MRWGGNAADLLSGTLQGLRVVSLEVTLRRPADVRRSHSVQVTIYWKGFPVFCHVLLSYSLSHVELASHVLPDLRMCWFQVVVFCKCLLQTTGEKRMEEWNPVKIIHHKRTPLSWWNLSVFPLWNLSGMGSVRKLSLQQPTSHSGNKQLNCCAITADSNWQAVPAPLCPCWSFSHFPVVHWRICCPLIPIISFSPGRSDSPSLALQSPCVC